MMNMTTDEIEARPMIRLTKRAATNSPRFPTPNMEDYVPGGQSWDNPGISLPIDYTMTGRLIKDVETGARLEMLRYTRNDVEMLGTMSTSPVDKIVPSSNGLEVHTENSVYDLEWL